MRILLIEDTKTGATTTTAILIHFGVVHTARSIAEAKAVIASGFMPDVFVTDLNLGDRRRWQETVDDVIAMAKGRPVAAHTAQVRPELADEFARLYSGYGAQLFGKMDERPLKEWLRSLRRDESGGMVRTMDQGSTQSTADMRGAILAYAEELGFPPPVERRLRRLVECIVRWERRAESASEVVWKTLVGGLIVGAMAWLAWAAKLWISQQ